MRTNFYDILSSHSRAYPKMLAEDYYILAYESEFGRVFNGDDDAGTLINELAPIKNDALEPFTVTIGGGYSRLNLSPIKQYLSAHNILSLIALTEREGSDEGFSRKLSLIRRSAIMGILPIAASGVDKLEGEVKHSAPFRHLYGASYRIISSDLAPIVPALCLISEALGKAERVTVALDGRRASGKSFASNVISQVFASDFEGGRLTLHDSFGSFERQENADIKVYFDTDEDTRRLRITDDGGDFAYGKYISEIKPQEDDYIMKNEPAINCDLVIRT